MLTLLLGGARSGKSALALDIAKSEGPPITFLATAEPLDAELAERIKRHRAERPENWETVEEPIELERALQETADSTVVVVDCLTLWVSNLLSRGFDDEAIFERASDLATRAHARPGTVVVVSNEVGSGIVPANAISRRYRDTLGRVNAIFATRADKAFLVVAGRVLALAAVAEPTGAVPRREQR
ncbi:MAG: bifunctional adenosylcobinamide kinase/adenosylcobinamide-phosphate guanylyltransferase [Acidimicrobiales bacterium]|jgi:adenosyl cobinamide kinase/adenosyl cobinamide phosphate guanylyltransferase